MEKTERDRRREREREIDEEIISEEDYSHRNDENGKKTFGFLHILRTFFSLNSAGNKSPCTLGLSRPIN